MIRNPYIGKEFHSLAVCNKNDKASFFVDNFFTFSVSVHFIHGYTHILIWYEYKSIDHMTSCNGTALSVPIIIRKMSWPRQLDGWQP